MHGEIVTLTKHNDMKPTSPAMWTRSIMTPDHTDLNTDCQHKTSQLQWRANIGSFGINLACVWAPSIYPPPQHGHQTTMGAWAADGVWAECMMVRIMLLR